MTASRSRPKRHKSAPGSPQRKSRPYHHGDLRRVLIEAALRLVEEGGAGAVSMREIARRAGVSTAAPFRHFQSHVDLMVAVAAEAQQRFRTEIAAAMSDTPADDPLAQFRALGIAYLKWALRNPSHFEVISNGKYFRHDADAGIAEDNAEVIGMTGRLLEAAFAQGQLRTSDLQSVQTAGRALVYGFARMKIDGHFPRWGIAGDEAERTAEAIVALFIDGIAASTRC